MIYFTKAAVIVSSFDNSTLEKMKACKREEFPICLSETISRVFGETGKKVLRSFTVKETSENAQGMSVHDIHALYEKCLERASSVLGDSVGKVIEFESVKEMERMLCTSCPLYEKHKKKE